MNHFCSNWSVYVLLTWLPSYFNTFEELSIASAGFFSALPWVLLFIVSNLAATLADQLIKNGMGVGTVRKLMQSIGLGGAAIFLLIASQVDQAGIGLLALCSAVGLLGFTWSGFAPNHLEIAPRYADVLSGVTNTAGTLPGIIGVALTGLIVDLTGSFAAVFQLAAFINVCGVVIWILWSKSKIIVP